MEGMQTPEVSPSREIKGTSGGLSRQVLSGMRPLSLFSLNNRLFLKDLLACVLIPF
jgi:hypothetical protein